MSERVRRLGGRLAVTDGAEAGTVIEAVIPWRIDRVQQPQPVASDRGVPRFAALAHA
jgi:hypothetical protein